MSTFPDELIAKPNEVGFSEDHPSAFLRELSRTLAADVRFTFNTYQRLNTDYGTRFVDEQVGNLTAEELLDNKDELDSYIKEMSRYTHSYYGSKYEYGVLSKVNSFGPNCYLPCIDLICKTINKDAFDKFLSGANSIVEAKNAYLFYSGNSFHLYFDKLISPLRNKRFQTYLQKHSDIVDIKWVAHSIDKGYGVLRWSAISHKSVAPKLVEKISLE